MQNKKSGLNKKISSIFGGIPEINDGAAGKPGESAGGSKPAGQDDSLRDILRKEVFKGVGETPGSRASEDDALRDYDGGQSQLDSDVVTDQDGATGGSGEAGPSEKIVLKTRSIIQLLMNNFFNTDNVGLDIGVNSAKIVELKPGKGSFTLAGIAIKEFPSGDISREKTPVHEYISEMFSASGCTKKFVTAGVYGPKVNVVSFFLPPLQKKHEFEAAIRWEFSKQSSLPLAESTFGYAALGSHKAAERVQIFAAAALNGHLRDRISLIEQGGLFTEKIGTVPFALENVMKACGYAQGDESTVFIEMGAKFTQVCFFSGSKLQFAREISFGGNDVTSAMAVTLSSDRGPVTLDIAAAEELKRRYGIPAGDVIVGDRKIANTHITAFMRPVLERIAGDIQRSVSYYQRLFKVDRISRVLLCGGGANLKNFDGFLSASLNIPVSRVNPLLDLKLSFRASNEELDELGTRFAVPLGLAMGSCPRINLIPDEVRELRLLNHIKFGAAVFLAVSLLFMGSFYLYLGGQSKFYKEKLLDVLRVYQQVEPVMNKLKEFNSLNGKLKFRKDAIESVMMRHPAWDSILKEVSYLIPESVFLTRVSVIKDTEPRIIKFEGVALGAETADVGSSVAQFMNALTKSPFFRLIDLQSQKDIPGYDAAAASFTITAEVVY